MTTREAVLQKLDDEFRFARQRNQTSLITLGIDVDEQDEMMAALDRELANRRAAVIAWLADCEAGR